jgi:hypothetical protein
MSGSIDGRKPRVWPRRVAYVAWALGFANLARGTTSHLIVGGAFLLLAFALGFWAQTGVSASDEPAHRASGDLIDEPTPPSGSPSRP